MATKLDLTLTATPPEGDHALICLVGSKGALIPKLDKDLAAAVISAMSTARFTGEAGKSATLNLEARTVVLVGTGDSLDQGLEAETTGGTTRFWPTSFLGCRWPLTILINILPRPAATKPL